jgi:uncharacterized protein
MRYLVFALLIALTSSPAFAAPLERTDTHVIDSANLLTNNEEALLRQQLSDFMTTSKHEVALVTLNSISNHGGAAIASTAFVRSFSAKLFQDWRVGGNRNDGILIVIAKDDRKMRIHLGGKFGRNHDARMQGIVNGMTANFKNNNFSAGIFLGVDSVITHFNPKSRAVSGLPLQLVILAAISVFLLVFAKLAGRAARQSEKCPACGERALSAHSAPSRQPGGSRVNIVCTRCDHRETGMINLYYNPVRHGGARNAGWLGGSLSGGGRSGGGGASGGW